MYDSLNHEFGKESNLDAKTFILRNDIENLLKTEKLDRLFQCMID